MALVYVCDSGQGEVNYFGNDIPACNGNGVWVQQEELVRDGIEFQISQLDPQTIGEAFGAGFIIAATGWVLMRVAGAVLEAIRTF